MVAVEPLPFNFMQLNQLPQSIDGSDPSNKHDWDSSTPGQVHLSVRWFSLIEQMQQLALVTNQQQWHALPWRSVAPTHQLPP